MKLSRQSIAALTQLLHSLPDDNRHTLLYKHLAVEAEYLDSGQQGTREVLEAAGEGGAAPLVREILVNTSSVRADAPTKYVFDERFTDLRRWLLHDGWTVADGELQRIGAAIEDVIEVRDVLLDSLEASELDHDGAIRQLIDQSEKDLFAEPPDYNGSGTNARVALETLVRRLAVVKAEELEVEAPKDLWGSALYFLRSVAVLDSDEEAAFAALYTFVSDAAHVPLSDEEWARLARAFMLSSCYYLLKKG